MFGVICSEHVALDSVRMISINQKARTTYWFCVNNNFFEWRRVVMKCLHLFRQNVEEAIYAAIDRGDRQGSFGVKSIPPTNHVLALKADCSTTQFDFVNKIYIRIGLYLDRSPSNVGRRPYRPVQMAPLMNQSDVLPPRTGRKPLPLFQSETRRLMRPQRRHHTFCRLSEEPLSNAHDYLLKLS
jgi:hypothetical protein